MKSEHQTYSFGEFTLDLTRGCLLHRQEDIKLRPKSFQVLKYLVENNGRLISKDELIKAIWVDTAVTDDSLVQCLKDIRRALRDEVQQIIKTVHGRGYIFDQEVKGSFSAQVTTHTEDIAGSQVIIEEEVTNGCRSPGTQHWLTSGSVSLIAAPRVRSIETLMTAIKPHRWSAALGVLTLAVTAAVFIYFTRPGEVIDSVAIMPFVNVNADPNTDYLSEGISDSIINNLSQLPSLTVISQSSTLRYKGRQIDPKQVGQDLGVRAVLTGRFVHRGDSLSVSAELVDVRDNTRLWAHQYHRKMADIMAMQEDISLEISEKLRVKLSPEERKQLAKRYTENIEAYQAFVQGYYYLMGHHHLKKGDVTALKSIEYFEQAIRIDPGFAPAYAALARAHYGEENFSQLPKESRQKIESALRKALELDSNLADVHALRGAIRQDQGDWQEAEKEFKRAIEINPNGKGVHWYYARYLSAIGRNDEAIAEAKRGLEIDPLSALRVGIVAYYYLNARQSDQAIQLFRKALEMDQRFAWAHVNLGRAFVQKGLYREAIAELENGLALNPKLRATYAPALAYAYAVSGNKAEAQKILDELKNQGNQRPIAPVDLAIIHTGMGETDQAFEWLEKAYEDRPGPPFLAIDFMFDSLRSDRRFADVAKRKGLGLGL